VGILAGGEALAGAKGSEGYSGVSAAGSGAITLFRSVGADEAADIATTGIFNNPVGINVKNFATSAEDAATWGDWLNVGESTVVTTMVPSAVLNGVQAWSRLDGIGQAFAFDAKQLANLNRAMDGIRVVP
jgi:hypothetical protein